MPFGAASISLVRNIIYYFEVLLRLQRCFHFVLDQKKTYSHKTKQLILITIKLEETQ